MSKFILTDSPAALPGSCFLCGSASREFFIDTSLNIEFHGAVYICTDQCLREMVSLTGFITPEKAEKLQEQNRQLMRTISEQIQAINGLEKVVDGFRSIPFGQRASIDDSSTVGDNVNDASPDEGVKRTPALDEGKSDGPVEPADDEAVGELRPTSKSFELPGIG